MWLSIIMNVQQLRKNIRTRFDHKQARLVLHETYQAKMLFAYNGGMWRAGPDLITLCNICDGEVVLEDVYNTPVQVKSNELKDIAMKLWQEQMNAWHAEYTEISKLR